MNACRLRSAGTGLILLVTILLAAPAAAQIPPGITSIEQLTPEQRAELLRRLQAAGATLPQAPGQTGEAQLPASLIPQAGVTPAVTRVDTTQFYVESPYDFGATPGEMGGGEDLELFGRSMFALTPATFEPPVFGPVGPDYQLGPGDEVVISMWGDYDQIITQTLTREGYILLPRIGQVVLNGLTLVQARQRLLQTMTPSYQALNYGRSGASAQLDVTLGKIRAITVYVMGDAQRAGALSLSGLSTAFTALYVAGGPSNRGSLRDIRVVRDVRTIAHLDGYDYLLKGNKGSDVYLRDGDIVFIPTIGPKVNVQGRVLRPAVYELKGNETLREVIDYAGGLTASAFRERAQVARILPPAERGVTPWVRVVFDVNLDRVLTDPAVTIPVIDGDVLTVLPIPADRRNFVIVEGAVWNPGRLELREGLTIRRAVEQAGGLREEALGSRVEIVRTRPDETTEQLRAELDRVMLGDPENDLVLQPRDRIHVYSIHDLYPLRYVTIFGRVGKPGRYLLHDNMTVMDLIVRAGGLTKDAWTQEAEVIRVRFSDAGETTQYDRYPVPIDTTYAPNAVAQFTLEDFDQVFIRQRPLWDVQRNVTIQGEVMFPGDYALLRDDEKVADLLARAGGLTPYANARGARFTRAQEDAGRVNIDLERALSRPQSIDNIVLQPGDVLFVPPRVDFVTVRGAVGFPTSVLYERGRSPRFYISQAGGYAENADTGRTRVVLPNGSMWRPRWFFIPDPEVEAGSEIIVPVSTAEKKDTWEIIRDTTAILSSLTTALLLIWQIRK
jgi:polysaccharide export outer membrane protein